MNRVFKPKKCKYCTEVFTPTRSLQSVCNYKCGLAYTREKQQNKATKERRTETRELKEKALTHKDWLNLLQVVFNTYIRVRDRHRLCICCDKPLTEKYDAGHFYSVGGNPGLRFNEDNCHAQRSDHNQHLHGNLIEYAERLPLRIGQERFNKLRDSCNISQKLSIPELKELISSYRVKTKQLNK